MMEVESGGSQQFLEEGDGVVPFPGVQYGPDIPAELVQVTRCFLIKYSPNWTEEYFMQNIRLWGGSPRMAAEEKNTIQGPRKKIKRGLGKK